MGMAEGLFWKRNYPETREETNPSPRHHLVGRLVCPVSYEEILQRIKNNCLFLGRLLVMSIQQLRIGRCCNLFLDVFLNIGFLRRHPWPKLPRDEIGSSLQLITFSRCNGGHLSNI